MLDSILRKIAPFYLLIAKKVEIYKTISYHWNKYNTKEAHLIYINFAYGYFHDYGFTMELYFILKKLCKVLLSQPKYFYKGLP